MLKSICIFRNKYVFIWKIPPHWVIWNDHNDEHLRCPPTFPGRIQSDEPDERNTNTKYKQCRTLLACSEGLLFVQSALRWSSPWYAALQITIDLIDWWFEFWRSDKTSLTTTLLLLPRLFLCTCSQWCSHQLCCSSNISRYWDFVRVLKSTRV